MHRMKKMNRKQNNTEIFSGKIGRIVVIVLVLILLTQVVFFYCRLYQYDTYGEPGYTYHVSYEEWMQMIAQAQEMKDNWIVDNVTGINLAVSLAMGILFVVFVRVTKENRIQLRGVKQTVIGASIVYAGSLLLIRLTTDQFRLYMNFTAAEVIALAILVFLFANRSTLLGCTKCTGQGRA